ncbi:MAG: preprotein translocase subunit SecA, partial [Lactobacillus iners]|nr:preprotein translocase subunit SecA [Lactobacillus iners]
NQLRGRSGRQGDPGTSQFYLSLEDDLIRRYGTDRQNKIKEKIVKSGHEFEAIRSKLLLKSISIAQKKIEGNNFDQRKNTLRYDEILSKERSTIYAERKKVLNYDGDISDYLLAMFARTINHNVNNFCRYDNIRDYDGLCQFISGIMGLALSKSEEEVLKQKSSELLNPEQLQELEKVIILKAVNENWKNNISNTEQLRQSISLRGYGQYNPLVEYQRTSFILYNQMLSDIDQTITRLFMRAKIITQ